MANKKWIKTSALLVAYACTHAFGATPLYAQFSDPYDPDFPQDTAQEEPLRTKRPSKKTGERPKLKLTEEGEAGLPDLPEVSEIMPLGLEGVGPFLLLDRPDPAKIFSVDVDTRSPESRLRELLIRQRPFRVDQLRLNDVRRKIEQGTLLEREFLPPPTPTYAESFRVQSATQIAQPLPDEVELPSYGTSLSVTGRKVISFNFSQKRFIGEQKETGRSQNTSLIDIEQQLQLRMQGKVGPKITVNVDYDDQKENKQDISVVYTGDENEVVQNASFGDIDLSLPATEFVSYNKQLFGIRVDLKYKRFNFSFVGSRTKGTTKTKQFQGNTQFVTLDILDANYVRRLYYDLTFGDKNRLPLAAGSERIFISRQNAAANLQNVNEITRTVDDLNIQTSTFTGKFVELQAGLDYTINYIDGILTFRNSLDAQDIVAVDFIDATGQSITIQTSTNVLTGVGGSGRFKLIKTFADVAISTTAEAGFDRELKTFYNIGRTQIVRDNGRGNFFLKVLDQNRTEIAPLTVASETVKYPDTIEVDFENGIFQIKDRFAPFPSTNTETNLYNPVPISQSVLFQLDFKFRLKTFFLEPNLVLQSEAVLLDGVRLTRNVDYFIDYESGFLTFFNEQRIREDSTIDVTFEVAPFAGLATESLLGFRTGYSVLKNDKWKIGMTTLYQTGAKPPTTPSINELAESLLVYEADTQLQDVKIFRWLRGSFAAEVARSHANPNLFGLALVENMEGVKVEDAASTVHTFWQNASNPGGLPFDPDVFSLNTEDVKVIDINENAQVGANDTQKVLNIDYNFNAANSGPNEASVVYTFSPTGVDFSQKNILEIVMRNFQTNNANAATLDEINFHLGGINEDADGDGVFDTEDANLDGILGANPNEDVGFVYDPACCAQTQRIGSANGRIDSEDLNNNGRLDAADFTGDDFGYASAKVDQKGLFSATDNSTHTTLNFTGWHTLQIPLNISTATSGAWQAVKSVRISIRKPGAGTGQGTVQIARLAVVGNSWERGQSGDPSTGAGQKAAESLIVNAVNSVDNPLYIPIFQSRAGGDANAVFDDLFGDIDELKRESRSDNLKEQALELRFKDLTAGTTVFTRRKFGRAADLSRHHRLNFLIFGNTPGSTAIPQGEKTFFLRAGSDQAFFEVRVPMGFTGWQRVVVEQSDVTGDQIPDVWAVGSGPAGTVIKSSGSANLQSIGQLVAGVYSSSATVTDGAIWINEIHMTDPITRKGRAEKLQMDFNVPNWMTFGWKYRFVDRNYQTPTTLIANQDNRLDQTYLNFTRIKWFPMNFNLQRDIRITPNTNATGDRSNLVTLLQEGRVTTYNGSAKGSFNLGAWPRANLSYERRHEDFDLLTRIDDLETYDASLSYSVPWRKNFLPNTMDGTIRHSVHEVGFDSLAARLSPGNFNTRELTQGVSGRLTFTPWNGSSFNPNYSITTVKEDRETFFSSVNTRKQNYHKALTQTAGFTSSWRLLSWFKPAVSYTVTTRENNLLNNSTFTVNGATQTFDIGEIKTINRDANGNISLTLNAAEIYKRTRLMRSLSVTNSYQLKDGDVWDNIESGFDSKKEVWIRTPLRPNNIVSERKDLTLRDTFNSTQRWSPLEAYNITGRKAAFKTFSLTNNYVKSIERKIVTETPSKTIQTTLPDAIASLGQIERLIHAERFLKNMQLNLKYAKRDTLNVGIKRDDSDSFGTDLRSVLTFWKNRFDTTISLNTRNTQSRDLRINEVTQRTRHRDATIQSTFDIRKFRFTPKVDWNSDITEQGTGKQTVNTSILSPSLLIRADLALPRGLYLPIARRTLKFTNRIIWTNSFSYTMRNSPVTIAENDRVFNFNTSADYEIAKNLRMTLNGAASRLWHKFLKENEFISYQFGTTLTFQF